MSATRILAISAFTAFLCIAATGVWEHEFPNPRYDAQGWALAPAEYQHATSACQAAGFAAYKSCRQEFRDYWWDNGAIDEPDEQHVKDYERCQRVQETVSFSCQQFGG